MDFTGGGEFYESEEAPVSLRYEKLLGYCHICSSLCHKDKVCPLDVKNSKRARSYKGVVINGAGRDRENRDYHGKGKGKMFEEVESKSVKTAEIGHKRNSTYRGNYRGDGEVSHYRNTRREEPRHDAHERRTREQSRVQDDQKVPREEAKEEGEIKDAGQGEVKLMEEDLMDQPSQKFQEELAKTIAAGAEIVSNSTDTEKRLQEAQGLLEEKMESPEDEENLMGMDEIKALINWNMGLTWMQLMTCRTCQMWKLWKRSWHMTRMRSHKRRRYSF